MDIFQFYNSASRLALAIESSGLMPAVKNCRACLAVDDSEGNTNLSLAEAMLLRASNDYMGQAQRFTADDHRVAEHFHLQTLVSTEYWANLTEDGSSAGNRLGELVSLYSRLMFASSHLPRLLSLISNSRVAGDELLPGSFVLELSDFRQPGSDANQPLESAADPDRIARVIDGANMVYRGAALLAGGRPESLELASITGRKNRTLVFHGQQETATAVRRIIRHLSAVSATIENSISEDRPDDTTHVEYLVEQLPFLTSLSELERIGALPAERIGDIRSSVMAGSIMLVEAGVMLAESDRNVETDETMSLSGTVGASGTAEAEVEAHYLDHFAAARERMLDEINVPAAQQADTAGPLPKSSIMEPGNGSSDDLDDLIVDLNRLYKR